MKKLKFFQSAMRKFFQYGNRNHLPWRKKGISAYEVWVSEIMLQQTQVSRVVGYYKKFLTHFPTIEILALTSWEEFLPYYQGLGYYARGRNMLRTAKIIVSEYGGKFPKDMEELIKLPGVGPYTAAAIASFAYGKDAIAWDTNLRRIVGRFFFGSKGVDIPKEKIEPMFSLKAKMLNAAMMDFGSTICTARPKCGACPLSSRCIYFKEHGEREQCAVNDNRKKNIQSAIKNLQSVSWENAQVFVILHENHKKYYSSFKTKFAPFVVPASYNTRAGIKEWFRRKYNLELSVRSPHKKKVVNTKPTLFVNAQILSGRPEFCVFKKDQISRFK